jgi:PAS domain S-box-containing protein
MTDTRTPGPLRAGGRTPPSAAILKVVLVYAAFSSLWILLSDKALEFFFKDPAKIILASTIKGGMFVCVTSLLLYGLMRRLPGRSDATPVPVSGLRPLVLPLILLTLAISVLTAGGISLSIQQQKEKEAARLQAIADLKTRQIADWLDERLGNARFVQTSLFFAENYRRWREAGDLKSRDILEKRLEEFRKNNSLQGVLVLDELGEPLWDSTGAPLATDPALRTAARQAAANNQVSRLGPYLDPAGRLRLDFIAPLAKVGGRLPVVVLNTDPAFYLFPTLQAWPVPSASGETLLFRRDGDQVLFLNNLRHRINAEANFRLPVAGNKLLVAQAMRKEAKLGDLVKGLDYRGVPAMGVVQAIPGTDWLLLAQLDQSELYAMASDYAFWIALVGLLTLFVAVTVIYLFHQHQKLSATQRESEIQSEKLRVLQLLDAIAEGSDDAIFIKDVEGRYQMFNRAASRFTGRKSEEVLGHDDTEIFPKEEAEQLIANGRRIMADNRTRTSEEKLTTPVGEKIFLATKGPLHDAEGEVIGMFSISRDITEEKRAEAALRESEERFCNLFEHFPVAYQALDRDGYFIDTNLVLCDLLGYQREELLGRRFGEFWSESTKDDFPQTFEELRRNQQPQAELQLVHKKGKEVSVLLVGRIQHGRNGEFDRIHCILADFTEHKRAEEEREKLQARLLQAQKMESVGRLAGGVAHDFNNMLSVIIGRTELALLRANPAEKLHDHLEEIKKAAKRSSDLTRQLLAFARKQTIAPKVLHLNANVTGMLKMLQRLIGEDINLVWIPGMHLWPVNIDPAQLDQILANLSINARDAIAGVGKVTIETKNAVFDVASCSTHANFVPGEFVLLSVSDDGCGMEKEVLDHLFEPFFTTKGVGQGTGLGLATVYGIVDQNKGFINVCSEPGKGTTFNIYLPRFTGNIAESQDEHNAEIPRSRGETLFLVEDEAAMLQVCKNMLEGLGYTVITAGLPGEAMHLAESYDGDIHLLITDVVMPEMNGRELTKRLSEIKPQMKCLFMSGYTADIIAYQGVLDEGVHFIQKPFSMHDLAVRVRETLEANGWLSGRGHRQGATAKKWVLNQPILDLFRQQDISGRSDVEYSSISDTD